MYIIRTACVVVLTLAGAILVEGRGVQREPASRDCPSADNRNWVQGDGECLYIRTFDRGKTAPAPMLLVFLHGDGSR